MNNKICLIKPLSDEPAYNIACNIFSSMWKKISGGSIKIISDGDSIPNNHDIIVIGSDAVNFYTHKMIDTKVINVFDIRYGSDDYQLLSAEQNNQNILFIAGGCGRSTIYAVYVFLKDKLELVIFGMVTGFLN